MKLESIDKLLTILFIFLCLTRVAVADTAEQDRSKVYFTFANTDSPCTDNEVWNFGARKAPTWVKEFQEMIQDQDGPVKVMLRAEQLRLSSKRPESRAFAEYWIWRSLYQMKLIHLAHRGFDWLISKNQELETRGVRLAALECLNRIHDTYPSLAPSDSSLSSLQKMPSSDLPPAQHGIIWQSALNGARQKTARTRNPADLERSLLQGSGPYLSLLDFMVSAKAMDQEHVIENGEAFFKVQGHSDRLKKEEDKVHLILAQADYGNHQYTHALEHFRGVRNTSNEITQALIGIAWTQLMLGKYADAVSAAQNLLVGELRRTFAPEASVIMSIAFNETCHFPAAIEAINHFKRNYGRPYRWLYAWGRHEMDKVSPYQSVVAHLKKKGAVSDRVASEWIRSPIFQADQEELNAIYTERKNSPAVMAALGKSKSAAAKGLVHLLATFDPESSVHENYLVQEINWDLNVRNRSMVTVLADSLENLQLIEAEVYNSLGERIIAENAAGIEPGKKVPEKKLGRKEDVTKVWDWGRFPASDDENAETWEDEVGFLKTDLTDACGQSN